MRPLLRTTPLFSLLYALLVSLPSQATVIVGDKEWLQPSDLINHSWDDFNAACGGGVCNGQLGGTGPNITGWQWASAAEIGDWLLQPFSEHPGGIASWTGPITVGIDFTTAHPFERTTTPLQAANFGISGILGFSSTLANGGEPYVGGIGFSIGFPGISPPGSQFFSDLTFGDPSMPQETVGAWLYRSTAVPAPGTPLLILLGLLASLSSPRKRSQRKCL